MPRLIGADHVHGKAEEHLQATVLATFESNGKRDSIAPTSRSEDQLEVEFIIKLVTSSFGIL